MPRAPTARGCQLRRPKVFPQSSAGLLARSHTSIARVAAVAALARVPRMVPCLHDEGWAGDQIVGLETGCCARAASGQTAAPVNSRRMTKEEHAEGRRGFGHDRLPVATGSP